MGASTADQATVRRLNRAARPRTPEAAAVEPVGLVAETGLGGAEAGSRLVDAIHTVLPQHRDAIEATVTFLENGVGPPAKISPLHRTFAQTISLMPLVLMAGA